METLEAISSRRSVGKVRAERPPRELIQRLLEAAVQAPNHHLTQPWRFFVLAGKAREEMGKMMATTLRRKLPDLDSNQSKELLDRELQKPLRAPVLIVVAAKKSDNPKAIPIEDLEATAAAVENLLLAAHDQGLGARWRTGDSAYDPEVKQFFGLTEEDHLVGFVYVGYPDQPAQPRDRPLNPGIVQWRGWE